MRLEFTKMHGLGNDFIVIETRCRGAPLSAEALRRLADRHTGIGFDQALVLEPPRRPDTAVFYRVFNPDGREVEQCGNGARCIAALLAARGLGHDDMIALESPAGIVRARTLADARVSVDMGPVSFEPRSLPFEAGAEADRYALEVGGETLEIGAVSIGNPHAVLAVDSLESAAVERLGPAIEAHARFPRRVNVGFLQIVDRSHIRLRVHERGAGETLACGTGACAAVAVGRRWGELDCEVQVAVRGGEMRVNWSGRGEHIWLTGPAEVSFAGHVEV
jgi:diaminopimelate epimerase